jgi:hypothetical protein
MHCPADVVVQVVYVGVLDERALFGYMLFEPSHEVLAHGRYMQS